MPTQTEMGSLRGQLEQLREGLLHGTLTERKVWLVLDRTSAMLDEARGDPFEDHLRLIYTLLSTVWGNLKQHGTLPRTWPEM